VPGRCAASSTSCTRTGCYRPSRPARRGGCTGADGDDQGAYWGGRILRYVEEASWRPEQWAAVDDMQVDLGEHAGWLVRTEGARGLTEADAARLVGLLAG